MTCSSALHVSYLPRGVQCDAEAKSQITPSVALVCIVSMHFPRVLVSLAGPCIVSHIIAAPSSSESKHTEFVTLVFQIGTTSNTLETPVSVLRQRALRG